MTGPEPEASLQDRYRDLVARFRSQWTFVQYLEGISAPSSNDRLPNSSQELSKVKDDLRALSLSLGKATTAKLRSSQRDCSEKLDLTASLLLGEDSRVDPAHHREFFSRVKGYEAAAIEKLLLFYLLELDTYEWSSDEIDKVDFLATRMISDSAPGDDSPDWARVEARCRLLFEQRRRGLGLAFPRAPLHSADTAAVPQGATEGVHPDEISEVIDRFRRFKHRLGPEMLEPAVWTRVLRTNWQVKSGVRSVIRAEEALLLADLDGIFSIAERTSLSPELESSLSQVRSRAASFERKLQGGHVRLQEIVALRQEVTVLLGWLIREESANAAGAPRVGSEPMTRPKSAGPDEVGGRSSMPSPAAIDGASFFDRERQELLALARAFGSMGPASESALQRWLDDAELAALERIGGGFEEAGRVDRIVLDVAAARLRLKRLIDRFESTEPPRPPEHTAEARAAVEGAGECLRALPREHAKAVASGRSGAAATLQAARARLEALRAALWPLLRTGRAGSGKLPGSE